MLHIVIMAGGSGTRFWPASRGRRPKQFLQLATDHSLLRETYERITPLAPPERVWVVTAESTAELSRDVLPELPPGNVLGEPMGRDTAACVGFAAEAALSRDPGAVCIVLPADHVISDGAALCSALAAGARHVETVGGLLTFGIRPTAPETGFGYLLLGGREGESNGHPVHALDRFVEKPDAATAAEYLAHGGYLWNSGMFAWRAADLLGEMERQLPRLRAGLAEIATALGTEAEAEVVAARYPELQRISIDYGVMEGAGQGWILPVDFPWSDVGSWPALREVKEADADGNVVRGRVAAVDSRQSILVSEGPVIGVAGVEGLVVVATEDAVLVVPADRAQEVKTIVGKLKDAGWDDVL
jgi:mannose-1-phosphate guanylyltransferase